MDHWPRVVSLFFSRRMYAFLRYSLLKFHNSSEFFHIYSPGPVRLHTIGEYVSQHEKSQLKEIRVFR